MVKKLTKTRNVILLTNHYVHYCSSFMIGVGKYLHENSEWSIHTIHSDNKKLNTGIVSFIEKYQPDGIIVKVAHFYPELIDLNIPMITHYVYRQIKPKLNIFIDDSEAKLKMAIEHFRDQGYDHLAYCGYEGSPTSAKEAELFNKLVNKKNTNDNRFIYMPKWIHADTFWKKENTLIIKWLKSLPKNTGIITLEDFLAEQLILSCNIARIKIPEEVGILGYNNNKIICLFCNPTLSSIETGEEKSGYIAAQLLDKLMNGENIECQDIISSPKYIVPRASTNSNIVDDADTAKAINYIKENYMTIKQVSDVTEAVGISRRVLERKFRKYYNRSILEQIRKVRINKAARALIETELPLSNIAESVGFPSSRDLWRLFKQEKKISPSEYRKKFE